MTAPEGPRAPEEVAAAVEQLRRWTATLPGSGDPRERREPRREVADTILDALEARLRGAPVSTADVASAVIAGETDVLRTIDELRLARDSLHRRLTRALAPELALHAIDELNELLDDVLRAATDHAVRGLRADAFTDALTGAGNRRAFERDLHRALETAKRHDRELTVVVLDLDGLKRLNDEHGHAAGDEALRALAAAFLGELRAGDGFYRIGGDEFALVLPESGAHAVDALLERAQTTAPSFSHGWAAHPGDGATSAELLQRADERLFEGRHERRTTITRPQAVPTRARLRVAAAIPVLAALGLAELIRRLWGVDLGSVLVQSWVGLLLLGAILGPPVARRWCSGHPNVTATAMCATRVGTVVLLVLVMALVPVHRLRQALDTAALQRFLQDNSLTGPGVSRAPRSSGSTGNEAPQFAFGAPAVPAPVGGTPSASTTTRSSPRVSLSTPIAPTVAVLPTPTPIVFAVPVEKAPLADIGTKTPSGSLSIKPLGHGSSSSSHAHHPKKEHGGNAPRAAKKAGAASRHKHH